MGRQSITGVLSSGFDRHHPDISCAETWLRRMRDASALAPLVFSSTNQPRRLTQRTLVSLRAVRYFSPRLLGSLDLVVRANSINRRIASERDGLSICCMAQLSMCRPERGRKPYCQHGILAGRRAAAFFL